MPNGPAPASYAPQIQYAPPPAPYYAPPRKKKDNTVKYLVGIGVLGGAGYLVYRYWYLPKKARQILEAETQKNMQRGQSPDQAARNAMASLCGIGGTALGAAYGVPIPPDVGQAICEIINPLELINAATQAISQGVNLAVGIVGDVAGLASTAISIPLDVASTVVDTAVDAVGTVVDTGAKVVKTIVCVGGIFC